MALIYDPSKGLISGTPDKKEVPNFGTVLNNAFTTVNPYKPQNLYNQMQPQIQAATAPISGMGDNYWKGLQDQATQRLNETYFQKGGLSDQAQENINSRGLIGSGIEQNLMRQNVYQPYAQETSDVIAQLMSKRAESDYDTEKFNRGLGMQGLDLSANLAKADQDMSMQFTNLAAKVADAEQGRLSQESLADLEMQLKQAQLTADAYNSWKLNQINENKLKLDALTTPLGDIPEESRLSFMELSGAYTPEQINDVKSYGLASKSDIPNVVGSWYGGKMNQWHDVGLGGMDSYWNVPSYRDQWNSMQNAGAGEWSNILSAAQKKYGTVSAKALNEAFNQFQSKYPLFQSYYKNNYGKY